MMKRIAQYSSVFLLLMLLSVGVKAQILQPVDWSFSTEDIGNGEFLLKFKADIDDGWYVYGQELEEGGPVPTSFTYDDLGGAKTLGKIEEKSSHAKEGTDPIFETYVKKFSKEVTFVQKVSAPNGATVVGYLEFMTCDDARCLAPEYVDFEFELNKSAGEETGEISEETEESSVAAVQEELDDDPAEDLESREEAASDNGGLLEPVKWDATATQLEDGNLQLQFTATIDDGWYVYSQFLGDDGPVPTTFTFEELAGAELLGGLDETGEKIKDGIDPIFEMQVKKFGGSATFTQMLNPAALSGELKGYLEFMTCDDTRCLSPKYVDFAYNSETGEILIGDELLETDEGPAIAGGGANPYKIDIDLASAPVCGEAAASNSKEGKGLMGIFLLGFVGGLIALLTPCVFPMIPLTVSFFTKSSENKRKGITNAFTYGFFIFFIYLLLSVPFHLLDGVNPDILNEISTNPWLNVFFFVIFVVFAFSFFGYFDITLPSKFTNRMDNASNVGGIIGIFFMAVTLALVSFSCTGPILGSLLAGALTASGGAWQLTAGMGGFGLALALPFALFAAFPGWLNSMPKSGGWLNTVKVVIGFVELALAFKFLSKADLVSQWGILKIEAFLVLWIIIAIGLGLYLIGRIKFPHDSPLKKLSFVRVASAVLVFAFAIYLGSGFRYNEERNTYHTLGLLSGLAPPVGYSWVHPSDCPQNLDCYKDYFEGMAYAKQVNKPVMLDFTGHGCENCRRNEEHIWSKPDVHKLLDQDYVVISLYVDEKKELPEELKIDYTIVAENGEEQQKTRRLKTVGNQWSFFQNINFNSNSQPQYVLMSPEAELLNAPIGGLISDKEDFVQFLECGLSTFAAIDGDKEEDLQATLE